MSDWLAEMEADSKSAAARAGAGVPDAEIGVHQLSS